MSQSTPPPLEVIPAGEACAILLAALANFTAASSRLIEIADACARAADATAKGTP